MVGPTSFDADFRVFVHNPPSEALAGGPAVRYQHGQQRSGTQEWRSNDREAARRKAIRIMQGHDADNSVQYGGWTSLQANLDGDWRTVEVFTRETV